MTETPEIPLSAWSLTPLSLCSNTDVCFMLLNSTLSSLFYRNPAVFHYLDGFFIFIWKKTNQQWAVLTVNRQTALQVTGKRCTVPLIFILKLRRTKLFFSPWLFMQIWKIKRETRSKWVNEPADVWTQQQIRNVSGGKCGGKKQEGNPDTTKYK